ncbi:MAG TPA: hypothetical protein VKF39_05040 [Nitrososphaerales archaeon]|nr:hypothetical protein [Nitrososphaerales archaeon]
MNKGLWIWPSDQNAQRMVLRKVAESKQLVSAMAAIAKSKEGLSNAELDDVIGDNSEWLTLNVVRQLTSLGFVEFKVDFFGGPAKYQLTDRGRSALSTITGKPVQPPQQKPPAPPQTPPPTPQAAAPKAA